MESLGNREAKIIHFFVGLLLVWRHRIMNHGLDTMLAQTIQEKVPFGIADHKEVPHWLRPIRDKRQNKIRQSGEAFEVGGRDPGTSLVPFLELPELHPEKSRLELVQARIEPLVEVVILDVGAVVAQDAHLFRKSIIVRGHGPPISEGPEVLTGIEAPGCGVFQ